MTRPMDPPDLAEALGAEFAKTAADHDRTGTLPLENFAKLRQAGLLALTAPTSLGGQGAGLGVARAVIGHIAHGDPSTALVLAMQYINLAILPNSAWPRAIVERVVRDAVQSGALINALRVEPELGTPSRGGMPATTARRTEDGWALSGRKIYSTGSYGLTYGIVWAKTDEPEPRVGPFLVPMRSPGLKIVETWNQLGMRATASHDVILDDVVVPKDHAVDIRPPAEWASREPQQIVWMSVLIGALYDGVARAGRDWLVKFLRERVPANLGKPLGSLPRIQEAVGAIERLLLTNAHLLASAAAAGDGQILTPNDALLIKTTVTENAIDVVQSALKLTGNHGLAQANPLERHLRNVLCGRIHSPQADMADLAAGRQALEA
ncbi:Acyl-CoA dehydrogenase [Arboricoccus pini]|uniref:Acyl-CoA dehydrogenase n=1 Tax=Arboricoccus pini TaxID=1963835 RepID=A0A212RQZ0_9PROT|nr:acyl-CoA dehydrogenase family protein [Arboricoccus pini]SNB74952.1 Acyl-CoA dehydrogenase [Arboricoccus pini]